MKHFVVNEVVTVLKMSYKDACIKSKDIRIIADNSQTEEPGFVVSHNKPFRFEWVPESLFSGQPFDSDIDVLKHYSSVIRQMAEYMRKYCKDVTPEHRCIVYNINRHLKELDRSIKKLI